MSNEKIEYRFQHRTVVVTGASGGIGRAVARRFAECGARVFLHADKNVEAVTKLSQAIRQSGGAAEVVQADFSQTDAPEKFVNTIFGRADRVDVWINGAGVDLMAPTLAAEPFEKKLQKIFAVDVFAAIQMSRLVGRRMFEQNGGTIFFFSWNGVHFGWNTETAQLYGSAKGALLGFSRSLAESLAPKVRIRCLSLGWIKTLWGEKASDEFQARIHNDSLAERWGTAEEVAETVLFLSDDASAFVDGIDLRLDGGKRGTR